MSYAKNKYSFRLLLPGAPGRSARIIGIKRASKYLPALLVLYAIGFSIAQSDEKIGFGILIGAFLLWLGLKNDSKMEKESASWINGANGEVKVADALEVVESIRFRVIHDFQNGNGNIDHIVVGPTGVFVIETKACQGRIQYSKNKLRNNGHLFERDPLKQVKGQAYYLAERIRKIIDKPDFFVDPVLCFVDAYIETQAFFIENVRLSRPSYLTSIVQGGQIKLKQEEIEKIYTELTR